MKERHLLALSAVLLVAAMGCDVLNSVVNSAVSGGKPAGTVADLWSDVPRMDGMTKVNLDLPVAAQLAIKAITQGNFDFIAYTTNKSPQEVVNFYTPERMKSAGWSSENSGGCNTATGTTGSAGGICIFERTTSGRNNALMIVIAQDDQSKQTQLFFVRVTDTGTPTK